VYGVRTSVELASAQGTGEAGGRQEAGDATSADAGTYGGGR